MYLKYLVVVFVGWSLVTSSDDSVDGWSVEERSFSVTPSVVLVSDAQPWVFFPLGSVVVGHVCLFSSENEDGRADDDQRYTNVTGLLPEVLGFHGSAGSHLSLGLSLEAGL